MRKIFTLFGAGLLGLTAAQAYVSNPANARLEGLKPGVAEMMAEMSKEVISPAERLSNGAEGMVLREYSDSKYNYQVYLETDRRWVTDLWTITDKDTGRVWDYTDAPVYAMRYYVLRGPITSDRYDTQVMCWCSYPTYDCYYDNGDYTMVDIEELINGKELAKTWEYFGTDDVADLLWFGVSNEDGTMTPTAFGIWSNLTGQALSIINGGDQVMLAAPTPLQTTQFTLNAYDPSDWHYLESENELYLEKNVSVVCDYAGEAQVEGFKKYTIDLPISNLHLYEVGDVEQEEYEEEMGYWYCLGYPQVTTWEPVHKLYVAACGDKFTFSAIDGSGSLTDQPTPFAYENIGLESLTPNYNNHDFNYIRGSLFNKAGDASTYGVWTMAEPGEYQTTVGAGGQTMYFLTMNPTAGGMVPGGYAITDYPWSTYDGLRVLYGGFSRSMAAGTITIGDKVNGMVMNMQSAVSDQYQFSCANKITYHYDPSNILLTREIDSVHDLDGVNAISADGDMIKAANGVISVNVANASTVEVYTVAGARVASQALEANETVDFNVEKGMYVVKTNNSSVKVVL